MGDEIPSYRQLPQSELDLNLMLTDSVWGKKEVPEELKNKLAKFYLRKDQDGNIIKDQDGNILIDKSSLWGLLGFFTRDMRLGNLSPMFGELEACRYMIDLANDLLECDMIEPFLIALSRAATILETSQSKGGFLRRQMNTLRHERVNQELEPPKKAFFGGKKDKNTGGY